MLRHGRRSSHRIRCPQRHLLGSDRGPMDGGAGSRRRPRPRQSDWPGSGVVCASRRRHHHQLLRAGGCRVKALGNDVNLGGPNSAVISCWRTYLHLGRAALTTLATGDLATIYPDPTPRVIAKARPEIDAHAKRFIAMSPFCVLATSGSDGSVDASPRGGNPGFVHVEGPNLLVMPDRSGNNRIDSFRNIVEGSGFVHLLFFVPGIDETLRVGGRGALTVDPELLAS